MASQHKLFQIFKTGAHTSMGGTALVFNKQDLEHIAVGYSKKRQRAPLVLGHPADNIPEYGEADALFVNGDALYAQATVSDALQEMVKAGSYKYVSPSFIAPNSPHNPTPGAYYLRHIGFLGAQPPAVKGMAAPAFAECSGALNFSECFGIQTASVMQTLPVLPPGYRLDRERTKVFMLAADYQRVCPGISFSEAAQRAETVINNQL
jgi:hypothetical protein